MLLGPPGMAENTSRTKPTIALLPGDGIGQEVIPAAVQVLSALAPDIAYESLPFGADHTLRTGHTISDEELQGLRRFDGILLGALGDPRIPDNRHARDILLGMRSKLDLYVNFRPCRALCDALVPLKGRTKDDVNFVVFRENTEGLYTGIGGSFKTNTDDEVAVEQEVNTRKGVERIIRAAFAYAAKHGRRSVTLADKANAMPHGHGLWRRVFQLVAKEYPTIKPTMLYVDNVVFQLVRHPRQFEVIVTNNLFGDIVTDLAAGLQGGLGMAASINEHPGKVAMFEPVHGSAPDIAGQGVANPMGALGCVALLLHKLDRTEAADKLEQAMMRAAEGGVLTKDVGGSATTQQAVNEILRLL